MLDCASGAIADQSDVSVLAESAPGGDDSFGAANMVDLEVILLIGALSTCVVLMIAPSVLIYLAAFVILAPIMGVLLFVASGVLVNAAESVRGRLRVQESVPSTLDEIEQTESNGAASQAHSSAFGEESRLRKFLLPASPRPRSRLSNQESSDRS
jgi:hypothetical protein